jgi:hypothetical protein
VLCYALRYISRLHTCLHTAYLTANCKSRGGRFQRWLAIRTNQRVAPRVFACLLALPPQNELSNMTLWLYFRTGRLGRQVSVLGDWCNSWEPFAR